MSRPTSSPVPHLAVFAILAVALLAAIPAARTADLEWTSTWRGEPIRIDGNAEDWHGLTLPVEKQRFSVGLQNDAEALYLCVTTRDRVLAAQIARQGLMVWLDPGSEKPKKHVFGIHFPIDSRLSLRKDQGGGGGGRAMVASPTTGTRARSGSWVRGRTGRSASSSSRRAASWRGSCSGVRLSSTR